MVSKITKAGLLAGVVAATSSVAAIAVMSSPKFELPAASTANAMPLQPVNRPHGHALTAKMVAEELTARGFTDVTPARRKSRLAVLHATAPRGQKMTLVVDLSTGIITGARVQQTPPTVANGAR